MGSSDACLGLRPAGWAIASTLSSHTLIARLDRLATWKSMRPTTTLPRSSDLLEKLMSSPSSLKTFPSLRSGKSRESGRCARAARCCTSARIGKGRKAFLREHGFPHAPFAVAESPEGLRAALDLIGTPSVAQDSRFRIRRQRAN